jgi:hypothetical protein
MVTPAEGPSAAWGRLKLFISYASEDEVLAEAIARGLRDAFGPNFADVFFDKLSLRVGEEYRKQLADKLAKSDILIIVYTGATKPSHSFTGWEIGYFEANMDKLAGDGYPKEIVSMFLDTQPAPVAGYQGLSLRIPLNILQLDEPAFVNQNKLKAEEPICAWVAKQQKRVEKYREQLPIEEPAKPSANGVCEQIRLSVFRYLKTTVETVQKPQKQITIRCAGHLFRPNDTDLPNDATIIEVGSGTMSEIFGLTVSQLRWESFVQQVRDNRQKDAWIYGITIVVLSALQGLNIDNSQIIVSADESKSYRLILTTATKYFDDSREFSLYFVETFSREEYGDKKTTLLLKGLEQVCRFRFMFLEHDSKFSAENLLITRSERLPELASELLRELNLLRKDSLNAGLSEPTTWANFLDWTNITEMARTYEPVEREIRELVSNILRCKDKADEITALRTNLSNAVKKLAEGTRPHNTLLIKNMSEKLRELVSEA